MYEHLRQRDQVAQLRMTRNFGQEGKNKIVLLQNNTEMSDR